MKIGEIAGIAHEVNRAYCEALGDKSQKPWGLTSVEIQRSAEAGVAALVADPKLTPAQQHESWMQFKASQGWKLGAVKDEAKKLHPCMVPYDKLPKEQQIKDYLFRGVVLALLPRLQK